MSKANDIKTCWLSDTFSHIWPLCVDTSFRVVWSYGKSPDP